MSLLDYIDIFAVYRFDTFVRILTNVLFFKSVKVGACRGGIGFSATNVWRP